MTKNYNTRYTRYDVVGEVICDESRSSKGWWLTEKQGRIAEAALKNKTKTIGQLAEITGESPEHIIYVLEWARAEDLVDMVLARHGHEPKGAIEEARKTDNWVEYEKMTEETFPQIMAKG